MKVNDICSGCGNFLGNCVCSISIGPDGVNINHPNPTNLASKLRLIALSERQAADEVRSRSISEQIVAQATLSAQSGRTSLRIWLSEYNLTQDAAEQVGKELEKLGFKYSITDEITAMYSNTDWDSEWLLTVEW